MGPLQNICPISLARGFGFGAERRLWSVQGRPQSGYVESRSSGHANGAGRRVPDPSGSLRATVSRRMRSSLADNTVWSE